MAGHKVKKGTGGRKPLYDEPMVSHTVHLHPKHLEFAREYDDIPSAVRDAMDMLMREEGVEPPERNR